MEDAEVTALLADSVPFPRLTEHSVRDLPSLLAKLAAARERGWALDDEESFPGVVGVAVPLEGWSPSDPRLALGVALPVAEATPERVERVAAALAEAASALTNPMSARSAG